VTQVRTLTVDVRPRSHRQHLMQAHVVQRCGRLLQDIDHPDWLPIRGADDDLGSRFDERQHVLGLAALRLDGRADRLGHAVSLRR
jgi:hypothetical protein